MDNIINNLNEQQKDVLKEIGNIGAGNAVSALAEFLNKEIKMTVPGVKMLPISEVPAITGDAAQNVFGVLFYVTGDLTANILFLLTETSVKYLIRLLFGREVKLAEITEMEISAIKEVGNIISSAYLTTLNELTGFDFNKSVPGFSRDMAGALLSETLISLEDSSDYILYIETWFRDDIREIDSYFLLLPERQALLKLLRALGIDVQ